MVSTSGGGLGARSANRFKNGGGLKCFRKNWGGGLIFSWVNFASHTVEVSRNSRLYTDN